MLTCLQYTHASKRFKKHVGFANGKFLRMKIIRAAQKTDPLWNFTKYSREEVAAAAQTVLEQATLSFVKYWINKTQCGTNNVE